LHGQDRGAVLRRIAAASNAANEHQHIAFIKEIDMRLKDQVAIVTGAASGFGAEIARQYVAHGAKVAVADINGAGAKTIAAELGDHAIAVTCDVTQRADIDALVAATVARWGKLDIVVNNAGWTHKNGPLLDVDEATFDKVYAINVKSIFHMVHAVVPLMRKARKGVILNIGSTAGMRPRPGLTWYNSSKGAVNLMSKSLAVELGADNIRVNAICPVMGATGLLESFMGMPDTPENRKKFIATIPMGRLSTPLDIAKAAVFLASDDAEFITGVEFPVDGGRTV
jgi:3-oxoacyl-[acyl-carrier protein] reductase